jgi:hypothetical protein
LIIGNLTSISGSLQIENKMSSLFLSTPVYSSTPDWISDNPHFSTGAEFADFNNDGWLDFVIADGNDIQKGHLNVYYNNGNGRFPKSADWQSDDLAYNGHLDVADVNGDGWPDVAVSYLGTSDSVGPIARLYLNNEGILSSSPDWTADVTGNAFGVDFGDMNNDGRPDLAVATGWAYTPISYHNYVYLNIDGNLEATASWESSDEDVSQGCLWLDADNDSWLDLVFICMDEETKIYLNLGGMLETTASWETSDSSNQDGIMLTHGDVNSDGLPDLFATDNNQLGGSGRFKQYDGLSEGFFENTYSWNYFEGYGSAIALADVDGDNKLDLATGGWWDYTRIFINEGSGLPTGPTWNSGGTSVVEKIVFGNIGPEHCEHTFTKNFNPDGDRQLFHLPHQPIQRIINVSLDGDLLNPSDYTYSREHGWITVNSAPTQSLEVTYNYSNSLDMAISNWDNDVGNYLYYNREESLRWIDIEPGEIIEGSFTVENIGDPYSLLNWTIESYPDWGNWSFDPENGFNLTPEDKPVIVNVEVIAPLIGDEFEGEIKVINQDDPDDFGTIPVSLNLLFDDLDCEGNLSWVDVEPGETVKGNFTVKNIGYQFSSLNWTIESYPDWGNWSFDPENGFNLTPEDKPVIVNVEVIAPSIGDEFVGEIKVINQNAPSDYDTIPVSLELKTVTEPALRILSISGGTGVKIEFENSGDAPATNVDWNIKVTGGILNLINVNKEDVIPIINPEEKKSISTGMFLGFGPINIQFTLNCDEGASEQGSAKGRQILIFTLL